MGVGPFAQRGLDEARGLAIGFRRVGFGAQVLDFEQAQGLGVAMESEADTVVGHDVLNLNAMRPEEAQRVKEKAQGRSDVFRRARFPSKPRGSGRRSPNADIPSQPAAVVLAFAIASDAVTDLLETTELF